MEAFIHSTNIYLVPTLRQPLLSMLGQRSEQNINPNPALLELMLQWNGEERVKIS